MRFAFVRFAACIKKTHLDEVSVDFRRRRKNTIQQATTPSRPPLPSTAQSQRGSHCRAWCAAESRGVPYTHGAQ